MAGVDQLLLGSKLLEWSLVERDMDTIGAMGVKGSNHRR